MRKPLLAGGRVGGGPDARRLIPASVLPSRSSGSATRERSRTGGGGSSTAWEGSALSRASSRWYAAAQVWTKRVAEASWQAAWWMDTPTQTRGLGTRWPVGRRAPEWSPILAGECGRLGRGNPVASYEQSIDLLSLAMDASCSGHPHRDKLCIQTDLTHRLLTMGQNCFELELFQPVPTQTQLLPTVN